MKLVDTHCHLHFDAFDADREEVIQRSLDAGVTHLINVGTDHGTNEKAYSLCSKHSFMRHTAGLHPHSAHLENADDEMDRFIARTKPVAVGEIGLDYFKSEADSEIQKKVFRQMLELAQKFDLPVIVHSRNAFDDTYEILNSVGAHGRAPVRGVMHCFSYDEEAMKKLLDIGFLVSFTGIVTYKNASVLAAAKKAPLGHFMLETDAPYLAPQGFRGKRNEPAYLAESARFLAQTRGEDLEKLAQVTSETASRFFKIAL